MEITGVIEDPEHRDNAVGRPIGSTNVAIPSTNIVHGHSDPTGIFRDTGATLQSVVNPFDGILLHSEQEARRKLRARGTSIEKGRSGMRKELLRPEW